MEEKTKSHYSAIPTSSLNPFTASNIKEPNFPIKLKIASNKFKGEDSDTLEFKPVSSLNSSSSSSISAPTEPLTLATTTATTTTTTTTSITTGMESSIRPANISTIESDSALKEDKDHDAIESGYDEKNESSLQDISMELKFNKIDIPSTDITSNRSATGKTTVQPSSPQKKSSTSVKSRRGPGRPPGSRNKTKPPEPMEEESILPSSDDTDSDDDADNDEEYEEYPRKRTRSTHASTSGNNNKNTESSAMSRSGRKVVKPKSYEPGVVVEANNNKRKRSGIGNPVGRPSHSATTSSSKNNNASFSSAQLNTSNSTSSSLVGQVGSSIPPRTASTTSSVTATTKTTTRIPGQPLLLPPPKQFISMLSSLQTCTLCLQSHSPLHNRIISCDSCDQCYHQKCHPIPIPDGVGDENQFQGYDGLFQSNTTSSSSSSRSKMFNHVSPPVPPPAATSYAAWMCIDCLKDRDRRRNWKTLQKSKIQSGGRISGPESDTSIPIGDDSHRLCWNQGGISDFTKISQPSPIVSKQQSSGGVKNQECLRCGVQGYFYVGEEFEGLDRVLVMCCSDCRKKMKQQVEILSSISPVALSSIVILLAQRTSDAIELLDRAIDYKEQMINLDEIVDTILRTYRRPADPVFPSSSLSNRYSMNYSQTGDTSQYQQKSQYYHPQLSTQLSSSRRSMSQSPFERDVMVPIPLRHGEDPFRTEIKRSSTHSPIPHPSSSIHLSSSTSSSAIPSGINPFQASSSTSSSSSSSSSNTMTTTAVPTSTLSSSHSPSSHPLPLLTLQLPQLELLRRVSEKYSSETSGSITGGNGNGGVGPGKTGNSTPSGSPYDSRSSSPIQYMDSPFESNNVTPMSRPSSPPPYTGQRPVYDRKKARGGPSGSYEEILVMALQSLNNSSHSHSNSNSNTENQEENRGSKPREIFNWMDRYCDGLPDHFRPSASQALKKAVNRGRILKLGGGFYKVNSDWVEDGMSGNSYVTSSVTTNNNITTTTNDNGGRGYRSNTGGGGNGDGGLFVQSNIGSDEDDHSDDEAEENNNEEKEHGNGDDNENEDGKDVIMMGTDQNSPSHANANTKLNHEVNDTGSKSPFIQSGYQSRVISPINELSAISSTNVSSSTSPVLLPSTMSSTQPGSSLQISISTSDSNLNPNPSSQSSLSHHHTMSSSSLKRYANQDEHDEKKESQLKPFRSHEHKSHRGRKPGSRHGSSLTSHSSRNNDGGQSHYPSVPKSSNSNSNSMSLPYLLPSVPPPPPLPHVSLTLPRRQQHSIPILPNAKSNELKDIQFKRNHDHQNEPNSNSNNTSTKKILNPFRSEMIYKTTTKTPLSPPKMNSSISDNSTTTSTIIPATTSASATSSMANSTTVLTDTDMKKPILSSISSSHSGTSSIGIPKVKLRLRSSSPKRDEHTK